MTQLPSPYRAIAPDLRGYGDTEDVQVDATRGMRDFTDDILALMDALEIDKAHFAGHSLGGGALFTLHAYHSGRVQSLTLVNPASPYGFGGTKDVAGNPCWEDFAGSGGGIVNPEFARLIKANDRTSDNPQASPRVVVNSFYWKPPFVPENIEELLDGVLKEKIGDDRYPGDFVASANYPFTAPGQYGPINASSPQYIGDSVARFIRESQKVPVLWVRGSHDQVVANESFFDVGTLGKMGFIPNYPGVETYPPQPMIDQTRDVLEQYEKQGGTFQEVIMEDTGHTPFIEKPQEFMGHFTDWLKNSD